MAAGARIVLGIIGALMVLGGIAGVAVGVWPAAWGVVSGAVLIGAVILERSRYRSEAAERSAGDPGPGGGEPSAPAAPFTPTEERFIDPTTGQRLRVYLNPATGERRYYADEGRPGS